METADYEQFVSSKRQRVEESPWEPPPEAELPGNLYAFQRRVVAWALARRRASIFADTGMGKSRILLSWVDTVISKAPQPGGASRQSTGGRMALVLTPLATGPQLVREGRSMALTSLIEQRTSMPRESDLNAPQYAGKDLIVVANYDILDKFDLSKFFAIVLDESSILKSAEGKTCAALISGCREIPFRLSLTATPCPNDAEEMLNQAEFLGVGTRDSLMASFFSSGGKGKKATLRPHAKDSYTEWLCTWACWCRDPSDVGFPEDSERYVLPELKITYHIAETAGAGASAPADASKKGKGGNGLTQRAQARKEGLPARVEAVKKIFQEADKEDPSPWVVWCHTNDESTLITDALDGAVELTGAAKPVIKENILMVFEKGEVKVLVTKPSIAGHGLNWQHAHRMVFLSINDSFETYYQAIRRMHRFGQTKQVEVHVVTTAGEDAVKKNLKRKEEETDVLWASVRKRMRTVWAQGALLRDILSPPVQHREIGATEKRLLPAKTGATLILGDCVVALRKHVEDSSVDYAVTSPPFASLYAYSDDPQDMSNVINFDEFEKQFTFLAKEMLRVIRPGRLFSVHCMNLPRARKDGDAYANTLFDFRAFISRIMVGVGFELASEFAVFREATRSLCSTKAHGLWYSTYEKDATNTRSALCDWVLSFRRQVKSGEEHIPVTHSVPEQPPEDERAPENWKELKRVEGQGKWRDLAQCIWATSGLTVNAKKELSAGAEKGADKERHPTPLQLDVVERLVEMYTNQGEVVLDPFSGYGTVGVCAVKAGRCYTGIELNEKYLKVSEKLIAEAADGVAISVVEENGAADGE